MNFIKVLHTSDWHLGRSLYGRKRDKEFAQFLDWLINEIHRQQVDVLLIAGDVFDSKTPSNWVMELYYQFMHRIASSPCRHLVITAGNHDSPSLLNAPRELLRTLNIYVVGAASGNHEDEVLLLHNYEGIPELIVCAVPYLRDRDVREVKVGESTDDKERNLIAGVSAHYRRVCERAQNIRKMKAPKVPIIVMGHLFTAGGKTSEGDGVRNLYLGSLAKVGADIFPEYIDYLALGHLHTSQKVNKSEVRRYSGAPLAMSFAESGQEKSVSLVRFCDIAPTVQLIHVPVFQQLEQIRGTVVEICAQIKYLLAAKSQAWLEIIYEGEEVSGDLRQYLENEVCGSQMEILRVKCKRSMDYSADQLIDHKSLDELSPIDVFEQCLNVYQVSDEQRPELIDLHKETIKALNEQDSQAE